MFTDMRISAEGATTFRNYLNRHGVRLFNLGNVTLLNPDLGNSL